MSMAYQQQQEGLSFNNNNYYYNMIMQKKQEFQPTNILNSLFKSTLNKASKMLLSVVSNNHAFEFSSPSFFATNNNNKKKSLKDHLTLVFSWLTMLTLRFVTHFFPSLTNSLLPHHHHHLHTNNHRQLMIVNQDQKNNLVRRKFTVDDDGDGDGSSSSSAVGSTTIDLVVASSSTSLSDVQNMELISHDDGFLMDGHDDHLHHGEQSVEALGRAVSHILALLNELPVTSKKYEFAIAMADRVLDENTHYGNMELLHVNRAALSSAFECTVNRLYEALNNVALRHADQANNQGGPWSMRVIRKLPLGTYISAYMKGGLSAVFPALQSSMSQVQKRRCSMSEDGGDDAEFARSDDQSVEVVGAEKLAQELLWIIQKLRACQGVNEALVQWSFASKLSSLALNVNPRVQALLIKISASLLGDISRAEFKVHSQIQYRLLVLWLPLFCYASNGLRYPALSSYEKIDVERTMERMIASLSAMEQEIVLRNWLQDYAICSSDWPNLRPSYDRWCQFSRQLVT